MAVYRFRVAFEDYDGFRDIDIKSNQTFADLHYAIHQSIGYQPEYPSSFYVSNDQWHKGEEITILPSEKKAQAGVRLMNNTKLSSFIEDPHQKFYYTFNFEHPLDFQVELIKIMIDPEPGVTYPRCAKSSGEAPKQFLGTVAPPPVEDEELLEEEEPKSLESEARDEVDELVMDDLDHGQTESEEAGEGFEEEGGEDGDMDFEDTDEAYESDEEDY